MNIELTTSGTFAVGCNYWASHAGTAMWQNWNEEVVREDFRKMAAIGLQVARVFPLWPDFQPLQMLFGGHGHETELRFGEQPLPDTEAGRAGVSEEAMAKFRRVADIAQENGIKLAVGLVTGWMSGRLFVPRAFESRNVLTDPLTIKWQVRFVRYFVRTFKNHPAIVAWGPGNECNCMAPVASREQAWNWMNTICAAVRLEDPSRPIISGMHGLLPAADTRMTDLRWTIEDQAELSDMLTTHPYPEFTPHAKRDQVNCLRNCFHATAESRMYGDIGNKPCICEEIGTLASMLAGEAVKAAYIRNVLFNLWAHDCHGLFWWCGFEQLGLEHAPYDWTAVERELGLFRLDGTPRPVAEAIGNFRDLIARMPFERLPARRREAVCVLSHGQDIWANAWSSFILAKQAGFDFDFQYSLEPLKESSLYLVPGVSSAGNFSRRRWFELIERVKGGATLYFSMNDGMVAPFNEVFGVESQYREERGTPATIVWNNREFQVAAPYRYALKPCGAEVLAAEKDGNPAFLKYRLGKGIAYLLTVPLENHLTQTCGAFDEADSLPFFQFYREVAGAELLSRRLVQAGNPLVTATEHRINDREAVVILVNNQPEKTDCGITLQPGWRISATLHGQHPDGNTARIGGNDATVLQLQK